ncbi:MAG: hypothetical protein RBT34_03590 [Anaerolineaceae bacterium]|jgi:hypothetical protein|nr:hypothetical protein [Anaerolineaceae bacterium]
MAVRNGPVKVAQLRIAVYGGGCSWQAVQVEQPLDRICPQEEQIVLRGMGCEAF